MRLQEGSLVAPKAAQQAEGRAHRSVAAASPRLSLGVAVLVIAGLSGALWFGIARLFSALF